MIDAHHHLWDLQAVDYPWLMAEGVPRFFGDPTSIQRNYPLTELRGDAAPLGLRGSVHIQVGAADGLAEARWVDAVARANPDWPMVQVAFCDLTSPDRDAQLDALQALPSVRGIRQIVGRAPGEDAVTGTNALLSDPHFLRGLQSLAARGLRFDLQLIPELMEETAALLRQVPELPVALCHAGSPHDRTPAGLALWADRLKPLSSQPQIRAKLSGLGMFDHGWGPESFRPIVDEVLAQFGPTRTMWGSNFPVCSLTSDYTRLFTTLRRLVPDVHHAQVFGATAQDFYDLAL
ncbi:amidohydrolase family protein [Roseobacteraceae bacterium S113]